MKEIKTIVESLKTLDPSEPLALATVVRVDGSSYRRTGARMLVNSMGRFCGGISGGCLEGDALKHAQKAILKNQSSIVTYDTTQDDAHQVGVGLGCNGIIDVLISPIDREDPSNPISLLASVIDTRVPRVMVTITATEQKQLLGKSFLVDSGFTQPSWFPLQLNGELKTDIMNSLQQEASVTRTYPIDDIDYRLFIEVIRPAQHLVLFGGNYDIYPMLRLGRELGWKLTVVTNIHKADKEMFRLADNVVHSTLQSEFEIDIYTAAVLMAHDLESDYGNLKHLLPTSVPYIGMLGPRKRAEKIFGRLLEQEIVLGSAEMDRVFAPAGLDIGAVTPEEIAVSIVAEIRACAADRDGNSLRHRQGTIHLHDGFSQSPK